MPGRSGRHPVSPLEGRRTARTTPGGVRRALRGALGVAAIAAAQLTGPGAARAEQPVSVSVGGRSSLDLIQPGGLPLTPATPDADRTAQQRMLADESPFFDRVGAHLRRLARFGMPSVVHIEARRTERTRSGSGSVEESGAGVIFAHRGGRFVLTNEHVIHAAETADIHLTLADGRQTTPRGVWTDVESDLAVLELPLTDVTPATLGNSDPVDVGEFVVAMGSPFGLSGSMTFGIVSARGRCDLSLGEKDLRYQDFLQTDAAINPGNSGGPLFNLRGEVVGVNTAIASTGGGSEGVGFSIPINMAARVAEQLIETGRVDRAWLGVHLDAAWNRAAAGGFGLTDAPGARISSVKAGGPADRSGLRLGDIVVAVGDVPIRSDNHLVVLASLGPLDRPVDFHVLRGGRPVVVPVRLGPRDPR